MNKTCPKCGEVYSDDNDFCPEDGARLVGGPSGSQPTEFFPTPVPTPIPPQAPSGPGSWIYVLVGALGAIVIVGGIYIFTSGEKKDQANNGFSNAGKPANTASPTPTPAAAITNADPTNANKAAMPPPSSASPAGSWSGDWSSPSGAYLTTSVILDDDGSGNVSGRIEWTLRRTNRPDKQGKVGMSATEFVRGRFDPASRVLTMAGYRKDDPNNVLVMVDNYRLTLGGDSRSLTGKAKNGGSWNATMKLSK